MYPLFVATRGDAVAARRMMSSVPPLRLGTQIQRPGTWRQPEVGIPHIDQKRTISAVLEHPVARTSPAP